MNKENMMILKTINDKNLTIKQLHWAENKILFPESSVILSLQP